MSVRNIRGESQVGEDLCLLVELFGVLVSSVVFFWHLFDSGVASDLILEILDYLLEAIDRVRMHNFGAVFKAGNECIFLLLLLCPEVLNSQGF